MKPRHKKMFRSPKRQTQRIIHSCRVSISSTGKAVLIGIEKSDFAEYLESLSEIFRVKCTTRSQQQRQNVSVHNCSELEEEDECYNSMVQFMSVKKDQIEERLTTYSALVEFYKTTQIELAYFRKKVKDLDNFLAQNTAAIYRLGFFPCMVHERTGAVCKALYKIQHKLGFWEDKTEEIHNLLSAQAKKKTAAAVLKILKVCGNPKILKVQGDINEIPVPDIIWDFENHYLDELDISKLKNAWETARTEVRQGLCGAKLVFKEACIEFGITREPARTGSPESKKFAYRNVTVNIDDSDDDEDETDIEQPYDV